MKIRLFSDMHTEFYNHELTIPELDTDKETVLILAGDIGVGTKAVNPIKKLGPRFKHIIYVAGNHEFYHHHVEHIDHYLLTKAFEEDNNISYLSNTEVGIDGIRFFGGTMWTPMGRYEPNKKDIQHEINMGMNDFHIVKHGLDEETFSAQDAAELHEEFKQEISYQAEAASRCAEKLFVVTHHAPTEESVSEEFKGRVLNAAYHANMGPFIKNNDDVLKWWVHGHMHHTTEYMVGDCKVFTNPYGYHKYAVNEDYDDTKVWEI